MNRHTSGINVFPFSDFLHGHCLVTDINYTNFAINGFSPRTSTWQWRSTIINRSVDIAVFCHISIIKIIEPSAIGIFYGSRGWLAINIKHNRVTLRRIKINRFHHPTFNLDSVFGFYLEKLYSFVYLQISQFRSNTFFFAQWRVVC